MSAATLSEILADRYRRRARNTNDRRVEREALAIAGRITAGASVTVPFEHLKNALWEHGSVNASELRSMHNTAAEWTVDESGAYAPVSQDQPPR